MSAITTRRMTGAERRRLETHPKTGAAQLVEIRETVQEILIPTYLEAPKSATAKLPLFAEMSDDDLLTYGVPPEWLSDVRQVDEDSLLSLADRLPGEAAEALLELATGGRPLLPQPVVQRRARAVPTSEYIGGRPIPPQPTVPVMNPFDHPDAQRRFRVMSNVEELQRALEFPWDRWSVFLHPEQRQLVERHYTGPARVSGSAGTGEDDCGTASRRLPGPRQPECARLADYVFHTCWRMPSAPSSGDSLATNRAWRSDWKSIRSTLPESASNKSHFGQINLAPPEVVHELLRAASERGESHKFSGRFLLTEWEQVVDAWQLDTWEAYRDVARLGRKTRLPEAQRAILWSMFEQVRAGLASQNMITRSAMFTKLAAAITESRNPPFDFAVVDEAQDIGVAHLRFFAGLCRHRPDALFFAGDLGQRIFQQPFSWAGLGHGHSGTVEDAAGQLPHVTSDPGAGGPTARSRGVRCRWQ